MKAFKLSKKLQIVVLLGILGGMSSCKVMFTESVRNKLDVQGIDLNKVQFYNSEKILLKRTLSKSEASLASGKVTIQNGEYIEITQIKKKTPGILDSIGDNFICVRFEPGDKKYLKFKNVNILDSTSTYKLATEDSKRKKIKVEIVDKFGDRRVIEKEVPSSFIEYDNKTYKVDYDYKPELMIKRKQVNKTRIQKRTAKGIKVRE
jgi:hypothetical protein